MKILVPSLSSNDTFSSYFNTIKEIILNRLSKEDFVGSVTFEVNIKDGKIGNINIVEKQSIKI